MYNPEVLIDPGAPGLSVHRAVVLVGFAELAVNCCVWPPYNTTAVGDAVMVTGGYRVIVAVADFVVSA